MKAFQSDTSLTTHQVKERREDANRGKVNEVIARTATVNTLLENVRQQIQGVVHAADMVIGWQYAGANPTNDGIKPSSQKPRRPSSQSPSGRRGNKQAVHQLRVNEDSNDDDTFQNLEFKTVTEKDGRDDIFCESGYLSVQRGTIV